jgi:hypothetical protein
MKEFFCANANVSIYSTNIEGALFVPTMSATQDMVNEMFGTNILELSSKGKRILFEQTEQLMYGVGKK